MYDPTFSRFSRSPTSDRQTDKPVGFYGPIAPPGPNAPSSECPPNTCHVMSFHVTCHVISCQRCRVVPLRPIWTIMVAAKLDHSRVLATKFHRNRLTLKGRSAGQRHTGRQTWANFKLYLLHQFCSNWVEIFFTIHRRHRRKKMMDQNLEIRILWFLRIFWNFQKGVARSLCGRSGPLWSRPN